MKITDKKGLFLLRFFWITILLSFIVWLVALIIEPQGRQLDLFFLRLGNFWADATNTTGLVSLRDPYHNDAIGLENAAYPPLAYLLFYQLYHVTSTHVNNYIYYYYNPVWTILFVIELFICILLLYILCIKQFKKSFSFDTLMTGLAICCSYPMIFTIERGNILIFVVLLVSLFVFYYDSTSKWKKELSLFCISMAIGIKLSPALLVVLLFYKKDWKSAFRVLLYGLILFIGPFVFFKGGFTNFIQMVYNIKLHFLKYSDFLGTGLVDSYIKYGVFFLGDSFELNLNVYSFLKVLKVEVSLLLLLGALFLKEKWKIVLNVTVVLLILPSVSGRYCLLYLIPSTILFLEFLLKNSRVSLDILFVLISLILIYFVYRCNISEFLNYNFAIPILTIICSYYSVNVLKSINKDIIR